MLVHAKDFYPVETVRGVEQKGTAAQSGDSD